MVEIDSNLKGPQSGGATAVVAILVVGLFLLLLLYLGPSRYFNAQEVAALVEGADSAGLGYSVTIHNGLTGSYSFETT